nr:immunoglobulin light chain junction region [Macaca mulatta]MOV61075.1 immunoglobulin light chain junction region [Macaca mulatta]MOV61174.1 immunoglobulin light chain junction region [Macaca mulatta]MOV61243.1 immunoglobulin light chain junction region [Macaca mulatta]MOV61835.1 immunoglobulin light chain junction region [Macaca mulatta]
CMQSLEFPYTF